MLSDLIGRECSSCLKVWRDSRDFERLSIDTGLTTTEASFDEEIGILDSSRSFQCAQCARQYPSGPRVHLPKGRHHGEGWRTICLECFERPVIGSCHARSGARLP